MWMYIVIYGTTGGPTQVSLTAQQQKNLVWGQLKKTSSGHGRISSLFQRPERSCGRAVEAEHKAMDKLEKSGRRHPSQEEVTGRTLAMTQCAFSPTIICIGRRRRTMWTFRSLLRTQSLRQRPASSQRQTTPISSKIWQSSKRVMRRPVGRHAWRWTHAWAPTFDRGQGTVGSSPCSPYTYKRPGNRH
jgi:hypothetical protein